MNTYLDLFFTFARIGGLTFGGGYAMLPMLQKEVVNNRHWATDEELMDYYAIGQCTPGIIAVNTATFVGRKVKGDLGGVCATLGVVAPSLIIITVIAAFLQNFAEYEVVKNAFAGIRVCVCALILNAVLKLRKKALVDLPTTVIFFVVLAFGVFTKLSPVIFVAASAVAGLVLKALEARGEKKGSSCGVSGNSSRPACSRWAAAWRPFPSSRRSRSAPAGSRRGCWRI